MSSVLISPPSLSSFDLLGREYGFQSRRRLTGLRTVSFIGKDCEALPLRRSQLSHSLQGKWKGLDRADDDFLGPGEGFGKFSTLAPITPLDGGDNATLPLEVKESLLQLGVNHCPVGNH